MSVISIHTIHDIEKESNDFSFRLSSFGVRFFSFIKRITSFSFKIWFSKKLIHSFNELNQLLTDVNQELTHLNTNEINEMYVLSVDIMKRFITLKEALEPIDYFKNEELKHSLNTCLNTLYITEAKTKKIAKRKEIYTASDDNLKKMLADNSKENLGIKIK